MRILPQPRGAHVAADLLNEINRASNVGIDDVLGLIKILVEEAFSKASPGVRQKSFDWLVISLRRMDDRVDSLFGCQISSDSFDAATQRSQFLGGAINFGFVRRDDEVISVLGRHRGEFVTNAGRCAGYDCKWSSVGHGGSEW